MQDRLNQNDVTNRVNVEDPERVRDAILALLAIRYPGADFGPLARAFDDLGALFSGTFPGYYPCDTLYHDLRHTLDVALAMARLIEGHDRACAPGERLGPRRAMVGVLLALLHDAGYLRRATEGEVRNGAVFTKVHVSRSARLVAAYLPRLGFATEAASAARLVHFTGYEMPVDQIAVENPADRMLGWLLGTADLIGQMSDRLYLEKCREFLYQELLWGEATRETLPDGRERVHYASGDDLILKTPHFYEQVARPRMERDFGGVARFAAAHFDGPNLYQAEIERNMRFLHEVIETSGFARLRRYCYSLSAPALRAA